MSSPPAPPAEANWARAEPRRSLPAEWIERMVPHAVAVKPLEGGFRNANFIARRGSDTFVLRVYEHHPSICAKEIGLLRMLAGSVPIPEVIDAEPQPQGDLPPFAILRYVEGITLRELKLTRDRRAIAQAASSAGETLAAIGRFRFAKSGWIAPGPEVTKPMLPGDDPVPRLVDLCLEAPAARRRMPAGLRNQTHRAVWAAAADLAALDRDPRLVHCDFNGRNLLVRNSGDAWHIAAVLDWEFAVSASPLIDLANFLRYDHRSNPWFEPHFSNAFRAAGGELPDNWRRLSRLLDLAAICEILSREHLPEELAPELRELVSATVQGA